MFRLLSKESNIFSIPVYIAFLLLMVIVFNILSYSTFDLAIAMITFAGIALGYFCFNTIGLNYQTHLPLFLYTFFIFAFYPGDLDIGIAVALLTNSFIILTLTHNDEELRRKSIVLVGAILALNYLVLPATWPMAVFVFLHIIITSGRVLLHLFRLFFGAFLMVSSYFTIMYFFGFHSWDEAYFPFDEFKINPDFYQLLYLIPVALFMVLAVVDHFANFNKKSPVSKFKYTFVLIFSVAQLTTVVLYMGNHYEFLLLMALPASIILSRLLRFAKKTWQKELGLFLIIASLLAFKLTSFNFLI